MNRDIIMDHYLNPRNKEVIDDLNYIKVNSNNESCIDNIDLYILIDNNIIKDLKFYGDACAITTSASSVMSSILVNKSLDEVLEIVANYEAMINNEEYDSKILDDANCFNEIYKQENRKLCAMLPYIGIRKAIMEYKKK